MLLKQFCVDKFQQVSLTDESSAVLEEINEPYYEVEKIPRWRKCEKKNKTIEEFLVLYESYPLDKGSLELEKHFSNQDQLHQDLEVGLIPEDK